MKSIDLMFMDWTDNNGIVGDIVRTVVGVIILFIILLPFSIFLAPVFYPYKKSLEGKGNITSNIIFGRKFILSFYKTKKKEKILGIKR